MLTAPLALFLGLVLAALIAGVAYVIGPRRVVCPRCAAARAPLTVVGAVEVYAADPIGGVR